MIPKTLHFIWVGDETRRPDNCIDTWREHHPDWTVRVWGNAELDGLPWINRHHMDAMRLREWNGVADLMRWEIVLAHGGIVIDADSVCVRRLDEALLDCPAFACWENEMVRPGLIAAGYFGAEPANPLVARIIADIADAPSVVDDMAWKTVGPQRLTDTYRAYRYSPLRIYPSHYFIPQHFTGVAYEGADPVYAHQLWGSTRGVYDQLHRQRFVDDGRVARPAPVVSAGAPTPPASAQGGHRQRVAIDDELAGIARIDVFRQLCAGKRVLHVGCTDGADTDPATSLHLALEPVCARLDGLDPDHAALERLAPFVHGRLFDGFAQVADDYDLVLVPGLLDRVADVPAVLAQVEAIRASCWFVAVRDACRSHGAYEPATKTFVEDVHPDSRARYTPYTFANTLRTHSGLAIERLWFFDGAALLALLSRPAAALAA